MKSREQIVGHVSWELSSGVWYFLRCGGQVTWEVTGRRTWGNSKLIM